MRDDLVQSHCAHVVIFCVLSITLSLFLDLDDNFVSIYKCPSPKAGHDLTSGNIS